MLPCEGMRTSPVLWVPCVAACLGSLGACAPARMQVRDDVAAEADRIRIDARGAELAMGPWRASEIDRGWSYVHESGFGMVRREDADQSYTFVLENDDSSRRHVACLSTHRASALDAAGLEERRTGSALACEVRDEEGRRVGRLDLSLGDGTRAGFVDVGRRRLAIASSHELEGGVETPGVAGFEFRAQNRAVGALQVVDERILWVPRTLDAATKDSIALAAAALALYEG